MPFLVAVPNLLSKVQIHRCNSALYKPWQFTCTLFSFFFFLRILQLPSVSKFFVLILPKQIAHWLYTQQEYSQAYYTSFLCNISDHIEYGYYIACLLDLQNRLVDIFREIQLPQIVESDTLFTFALKI